VLTVPREECLDLLLSRRSVRRFRKEEVPLDLLRRVVEVARWAPSARNAQPWEFVLVTDRGTLERLGSVSPATAPLRGAAAALAVVVDPSAAPLTHQVDGAAATMYAWLAAHALGLGAVWINSLRYEEMKEILGVPRDKVLVAVLALGYPDEEPEPKPRKPLEELVHYERYGNREPPG